jgi:transcriptional regulator MraZ
VLRGNHPARVDEKGRIKIPNGFLQLLDANYGPEVFVTSLSGTNVRVYPMEVWTELERKLETIPGSHPSKMRFLDRVHFFGQATTRDKQGRFVIPALLRDAAQMTGAVDVLGKYNFLEIWNHERFVEKLKSEPFTEEDGHALAEFGI